MWFGVLFCCESKAQQLEPFLAKIEELRLIYCEVDEYLKLSSD